MKCKSIILSVAAALALFVSINGAIAQKFAQGQAQQPPISCPSGMGVTACLPGQYGPGGCYNPAYAYCTQGIVCSNSMRVCVNGQNSTCYLPPYGTCR